MKMGRCADIMLSSDIHSKKLTMLSFIAFSMSSKFFNVPPTKFCKRIQVKISISLQGLLAVSPRNFF
jgi:hypothetical protein